MAERPALSIQDLDVSFDTPEGEVSAVTGLNIDVAHGETLAIVGESGSGKSQSFLATMGLLTRNGHATGRAMLDGKDLLAMDRNELDKHRGREISMVFQDPMTAFNPMLRLSRQLTETLAIHKGLTQGAARIQAIEMLERVGIPDPEKRIATYPYQLSGGMRQRAMIAMALLCRPKVLIADEPTTALDVTIQAQILELFADLKREFGMALVLITHDLGVVAALADRIAVMYAGRIVEEASCDELFERPRHPYTRALLQSTPRADEDAATLYVIPGQPPNLQRLPAGCSFMPRCPSAVESCRLAPPPLEPVARDHKAACFRARELEEMV
ncbi:MAG TPA: ABC transporter ATP-binding protein [Hyphomicrobiales bacterium]|nr:ABC transporter ATP-binding protein [Hyphomicrobiales bacterium]